MSHQQTQPSDEIILFTRYPQPGKVKTRLIPILGENGAARLHRDLTEQVIRKIEPITHNQLYHFLLYYTGGTDRQMRDWLGDTISFRVQDEHDLGHRMAAAFRTARDHGASRAVLIGSDCPSIDAQLITTAFEKLGKSDLVLGPTFDGGYYLIGMHYAVADKKINSLFENISWGTPDVYSQTMARAEKADISFYSLTQHHDIDRPEDLEYFNHNPDTQ